MTSELYKVEINGAQSLWKEAGMYVDELFSPTESSFAHHAQTTFFLCGALL